MAQRNTLTEIGVDHPHTEVDENQWKSEKLCFVCHKSFGPFTKKYHCKTCFHAVCGHCSPETLFSNKHGELRRACNLCVRDQSGEMDLAIKEEEIEQLRKMLTDKEADLMKEVNEKSELWQKLAQASQTIVRLQEQLRANEASTASDEKLEKKRDKVKRLKSELVESKAQRDQLQAELESLRAEMSAQAAEEETQRESLQSKLARKQAKKETLKTQVALEVKANAQLKDAHETQSSQFLAKLLKRKAKMSALKAQLEEEEQHKAKLEQHSESLRSEFSVLKSRLELQEVDKRNFVEQIAMLENQILACRADAEARIAAIEEEREKAAQLSMELTAKEKESATREAAKRKDKIRTLKQQLQEAVDSTRISFDNSAEMLAISQLSSERSQCENELRLCQFDLSAATARIKEMESANAGLFEQLSSLKNFDKVRSEQMLELKQENASLKGDLLAATMKNDTEDLTVMQREIAAKDLQIRNLEVKLLEAERLALGPPRDHQPCLKCSLF